MMNWGTWNELTGQGLIWAANVFGQVTFILGLGLLLAALLRRHAAARNGVLSGTLVLVLLIPASALVMQWSGGSLIAVSIEDEAPPAADSRDASSLDTLPSGRLGPVASERSPVMVSSPEPSPVESSVVLSAGSNHAVRQSTTSTAVATREAEASVTAPSSPDLRSRLLPVGRAFLVIWFAGAVLLLIRLGLGAWRLAALMRSTPVREDSVEKRILQQAVSAWGLRRSPRLLESSDISGPISAGILHPAIILPLHMKDSMTESQIRDVLIHELAHICRRDQAVVWLQHLATALLWPHPMVRWLNRSLAQSREEVCDNYVLEASDAPSYSRTLLMLAARSQQAGVLPGAVGLFNVRWKLEYRVADLLDERRSRAVRLSRSGRVACLALLLVSGLATALGTVRLSVAEGAPPAESAPAESAAAESAAARLSTPASDQRLQGVVVNADGRPIAGARVYLEKLQLGAGSGHRRIERTVLSETKASASGEFRLPVPDNQPAWARLQVLGFASGYGATAVVIPAENLEGSFTLELPVDKPIEGRVVTTEGQPLAGIQVKVVERFFTKNEEAVEQWIQSEKPELFEYLDTVFDPATRDTSFPAQHELAPLTHGAAGMPKDVVTDSKGRFRIEGLGQNQLAILEISGPTIASQRLNVVTRDMKPVLARPYMLEGRITPVHHGAQLTYVAQPSQPITGTVTDSQSGQPLSGMVVRISRFADVPMSQGDFLATTTDEAGRFRLEGAPQGGGHRLTIQPRGDQPYFETSFPLPKRSGTQPIVKHMALTACTWIEGKVTDAEGRPVPASVNFLPFRSNSQAERFPNYEPQITGMGPEQDIKTDDEGHFRIRAIPGEGVIGAHVRDRTRGAEFISDVPPDLYERIGGERMQKLYHPWSAKWFHVLRAVDVSPDGDTTADLTLRRGGQKSFEVVDPDGKPVSGVRVLGRTFPPSLDAPLNQSTVSIIGVTAESSRLVVLLHEDRELGKALTFGVDSDLATVQLEPCAVVTGRFVDENGEPLAGVEVRCMPYFEGDNWHRSVGEVKTDDEGRFRVLVPPGNRYVVAAFSLRGPSFSAEVDPQAGTVYDLKEVANGTRIDQQATAKMARPVPTP